jgi:hypothetical protein
LGARVGQGLGEKSRVALAGLACRVVVDGHFGI